MHPASHTFQYPLRVVPVTPGTRSEPAAKAQPQPPQPAAAVSPPAPHRP
jgi:hypothetical protein